MNQKLLIAIIAILLVGAAGGTWIYRSYFSGSAEAKQFFSGTKGNKDINWPK